MPEDVVGKPSRRDQAVAAVADWVLKLPGCRPLAPAELRGYDVRDPSHGWRLAVTFPDCLRHVDLLLVGGFPRRPPRVALVDRPAFLTWPHIDEDGVLCLLGDHAEVDYSRPVEVAGTLLADAAGLVEDLAATGRTDDFRDEFNTYWGRTVPPRRPRMYSLLPPKPPSRITRVWRGRGFSLVGEQAEIEAWLLNRFTGGVDTKTEAAAVMWLPRPPVPKEFPSTPSQVLTLAEQVGAGKLLERLICDEKGEVVILSSPTPRGPCFGAVTLAAANRYGQRAPTPDGPVPGFRPGKAPRRLLVSRLYGGGTAVRAEVERADAPWVHGRGQDPRFERLRGATVAVLGCGSLGAPVALQLAAAGVGGLVLIDPETLRWANVGRHPLGARGVGRNKAEALAELIRSGYPHVRQVKEVDGRWSQLGKDALRELAGCDLVVSAIGDWAAEGLLNEWHQQHRKGPVVYGWTEAHACAGHAVAIVRPGACLQCGFSPAGEPHLRVTDWPQGPTLKQEPACGATYQPYGPIELGHIVSVIAETALDCLLGSVATSLCRTWVGRQSLLAAAGGTWNAKWLAKAGDIRPASVVEWEWPRTATCIECGAAAA